MFYRPEDGSGLPHNPLKACIAPRPIGWITTLAENGTVNLAPFSFFNLFSDTPPVVGFACNAFKPDGAPKDSRANAERMGEFVAQMVGAEMIDAMNQSSLPHPAGTSEAEATDVILADSQTIKTPRLRDVPAAFECRYLTTTVLPGERNGVVFGEITGVHLRDDLIREGRFDTVAARFLARLGYLDYLEVKEVFALKRPKP